MGSKNQILDIMLHEKQGQFLWTKKFAEQSENGPVW